MRPPRQLLSAPPSTGSNTSAAAHGSSGNATATNQASSPWGPFGDAATYRADMALVLCILLSVSILALFLTLCVRFCLRGRRGARTPPPGDADQKPERRGGRAGKEHPSEPPTLYSAGETRMAGGTAECAICLTEFAEGDALRVLSACRHGFHMECVERWLALSSGSSRPPARRAAAPSCPVCRASCMPPHSAPETEEP